MLWLFSREKASEDLTTAKLTRPANLRDLAEMVVRVVVEDPMIRAAPGVPAIRVGTVGPAETTSTTRCIVI